MTASPGGPCISQSCRSYVIAERAWRDSSLLVRVRPFIVGARMICDAFEVLS